MIGAFRDVYVSSGSVNFRSTMSIASNAQLSKQCVQPMHTGSETTAKEPFPRRNSVARIRKNFLYRSAASFRSGSRAAASGSSGGDGGFGGAAGAGFATAATATSRPLRDLRARVLRGRDHGRGAPAA